MTIGIVIAIARELKAFLESDFQIETIQIDHREIYRTSVNGNEIYALRSGWGLIDAAAATQLLVSRFGCETILNYGVTGALSPECKVDDLFLVTRVVDHDFDVSQIDPVLPAQFGDYPDQGIPIDPELIRWAKERFPNLQEASVASGNRFIEDRADKDRLREDFGCNICDMEAAAIARVCNLNKVRMLSIKSISDALDGDGSDFEKNVTRSAQAAFGLFRKILLELH